jgi:hypothetical protein
MSAQPCGTYASYQQHLKRGDEPCAPCRQALAAYQREWRRSKGRTTSVSIPLALLEKAANECSPATGQALLALTQGRSA